MKALHSAQPVGKDKVLFMQNGISAKLILMNKKSGKVEMEHVLPTARPDDPKSVHGQFRHVRMTKAGTYLVAHLNMSKVIEYDKNFKEIWSCPAPSAWAAVRLKNGNTVICNWSGFLKTPEWPNVIQIIEVTPQKKVVWALREWTDPDLGPASCIQLLDEPGKAENCDLQR